MPELEDILAQSRDYDELLDAWQGWRTISRKMREPYARFVELANEGAAELGYDNLGEMWRDGYDMTPAEFETESRRLWEQVKPLYDELHCHVRAKLGEVYGTDKVPPDAPIPAHLLGNMWSQSGASSTTSWNPTPAHRTSSDAELKAKKYSPRDMVRSAEGFYMSLGMPKLPDTFLGALHVREPGRPGRRVPRECLGHDGADDLRIKMCIKQPTRSCVMIYHELGHNYYQWAYKDQPRYSRMARMQASTRRSGIQSRCR